MVSGTGLGNLTLTPQAEVTHGDHRGGIDVHTETIEPV